MQSLVLEACVHQATVIPTLLLLLANSCIISCILLGSNVFRCASLLQ